MPYHEDTVARRYVLKDVLNALEEDVSTGDITGALIPEAQDATANIVTRESMVLAGIPWANEAFHLLHPHTKIEWCYHDGDWVKEGSVLCHIYGKARAMLAAERMSLNFLQTLSATATKTRQYVQCLLGLSTQLLDTRKTIPGLRYAQKYAVRCGGGKNHRHGLYDMLLIKENHIMASGSITEAIEKARHIFPEKKLEVEVETLNELQEAIEARPDIVMLDNFSLKKIQAAIKLRKEMHAESILFEVSGDVTQDNIREIAETGVDYISVGAITKHVQAIDLTLLFL